MSGGTLHIFISYAHEDEPETPASGKIQWLTFVLGFLWPAVKYGLFDYWVDGQMRGGADVESEIRQKLHKCDIFILLVSRYSMSNNIVDVEIATIRERQRKGEDVHFYPLVLTHTPKVALAKVKDKNLRPRDAKPFSSYDSDDRERHMKEVADEIAEIAEEITRRRAVALVALDPGSKAPA